MIWIVCATWREAFDTARAVAVEDGQAMKVEKFAGYWWATPALAEACS